MLALLLFIIFGLGFGYFATLNTSLVTVHFGTYTLENVSLYILVLASLGVGVLYASLFYLYKSFSSKMAISKKERELASLKKENMELMKEMHQLELENTRLKTKTGEESSDELSL